METENINIPEKETAEAAADTAVTTDSEADIVTEDDEEKEYETSDESDEDKKPVSGAFFEATSVIVTAITAIAIIFSFCFRIIGVNGSSMEDTLNDGDWLIVTPYYSQPQYGDIVIATQDTAAHEPLVKRVIGLPGDEVYVDEYDNVYVNGTKINDSSFVKNDGQEWRHGRSDYPVTVPENTVMLMGDHRSVSWDSRYTEIGFIDIDSLLGKAQVRLGKNYKIYTNFPDDKFIEGNTVPTGTAE